METSQRSRRHVPLLGSKELISSLLKSLPLTAHRHPRMPLSAPPLQHHAHQSPSCQAPPTHWNPLAITCPAQPSLLLFSQWMGTNQCIHTQCWKLELHQMTNIPLHQDSHCRTQDVIKRQNIKTHDLYITANLVAGIIGSYYYWHRVVLSVTVAQTVFSPENVDC